MKYLKILSIVGIGCAAALLLVFGMRLQAQNKIKEKFIAAKANEMKAQAMQRVGQFRNRQQSLNWGTQGRQQNWSREGRQQSSRWGEQGRSEKSGSDDKSAFYRVIVDNNIFRPLGWRPSKKDPEYTFIGTSVPLDGTKAEAYVLERRSNKFYTAMVGDKIGDAVVKEIKQKQITLDKNGEVITLKGGNMQFLQAGGSRRGGRSRAEESDSDNNNKENVSKSYDKEAAMRKARETAMQKKIIPKEKIMIRGLSEKAARELREQIRIEYR